MDFDSNFGPELGQLEHNARFNGELPPCMLSKTYDCLDCCLSEPIGECPVKADPDYQSYLRVTKESFNLQAKIRVLKITHLQNVLRKHKLPLHWEYISTLAIKEAPNLFPSKDSVKGLVFNNPDIFIQIRDGVFALKKY